MLDFSGFPETLLDFVPEVLRIGRSKFVRDDEIRNEFLVNSHITQTADVIDVLKKD